MSSVEDMLAIQQVTAKYSYAWDSKDAEGWANLFTEDAVWEVFHGNETSPAERPESRESIRRFAELRMQSMPEGARTYHHQSGILFDELTADSARTRTMVVITAQDIPDQPPRISRSGVYHTQWRKTPEGWRIQHRRAML